MPQCWRRLKSRRLLTGVHNTTTRYMWKTQSYVSENTRNDRHTCAATVPHKVVLGMKCFAALYRNSAPLNAARCTALQLPHHKK